MSRPSPSRRPTNTQADPVTARRREWQVTWRREAWAPTTWDHARRFGRRAQADAFVAKLKAGRPDLSPPVFVRLSWRWVGPWHEEAG